MLSAIKNFLEALTIVLKALTPLIREKVRESQINTAKRRYRERRNSFARAVASGDPNRIAAEWASLDDELLSEGITTVGGDNRSGRDTEDDRWQLPSDGRLDGTEATDRTGTEGGFKSMRTGIGSPPTVVDFDGGPML